MKPDIVKVLIIGRTPPPYLGAPIMLEFLVRSQMEGVELHHLPIKLSGDEGEVGKFRFRKLIRLFLFILRIAQARIVLRPQILYYSPELVQPRTTVLRDAAILAATRWFFSKTVFHFHASGFAALYEQLPRWQRWLVRRGYFYADGVIRQSTLTPDDGRHMKARHEYIVPNGIVDPFADSIAQRSAPTADTREPMRILFVSGLAEGKGILVLIDACGKLAARGVPFSLEVVGKSHEEGLLDRIQQRIRELNLTSQVRLLGLMSNEEKFAVFARSDVLCHPTFYDTFPVVLLEGMAAGVPVVSTTHSGVPSIVDDGETGFLVEPRDADAVADRLARLAADAELRAQMGAAGRRKFLREFTLPRHIERLREVFLDVAGVPHADESVQVTHLSGHRQTTRDNLNPQYHTSPNMRVFVTGGSGFIGTTLVESLRRGGVMVMNFDCAPPHESAHRPFWRRGDILDATDLAAAIHEFDATHIVHLAARADLDESGSVDDYPENIAGVSNLLNAVESSPSVERVVIASTQMVCQPGYTPRHDEDYSPNTIYGQSKIITERLTRQSNLKCVWTLIRPTNIWGPRHPRHSGQFFTLLKRGLYWHPSGRSARRGWGYVGNVAHQIQRILQLPAEKVDRQVFYVGDASFELVDWVNTAAKRLTGRPAKTAPRSLLYLLALSGEAAQRCGMKAPLSLLRYKAMTEDYLPPMEKTLEVVGPGPYSMEQAIDETLEWLKSRGNHTVEPADEDSPGSRGIRRESATVSTL